MTAKIMSNLTNSSVIHTPENQQLKFIATGFAKWNDFCTV